VRTRLSADELIAFCRDVERLFRINSQLEITAFRRESASDFRLEAKNLSNGGALATTLRAEPQPDGLRVAYADGLKTATVFRVEPGADGATLVVTDDYSGAPEAERSARLDEVDRSLPQWGHDLHRFLGHWARWRWCAPWLWTTTRWLKMTPSARRIAFLLVAITAAEFLAFLALVAVFWLEAGRAGAG
jgi:hypothetical protein